jgi:hypothetical protein
VTDLLMDGRRQAGLGPTTEQAAQGLGPFVREQFGQTVYYRIRGVGAGARC